MNSGQKKVIRKRGRPKKKKFVEHCCECGKEICTAERVIYHGKCVDSNLKNKTFKKGDDW